MRPIKYFTYFVLLLLLFTASAGQAQDNYVKSVGLRGGPIVAATYKQFIDVPVAIEGIFGFNFDNGRHITLAGLYEYHLPINYQLNIFGGAGLGMAFRKNDFRLLAEVLVGLEYTMPKFPVNFSFDYKPAYDIFNTKPYYNEFGVSIRYILD